MRFKGARNILFALLLLLIIVCSGVIGFMLIDERYSVSQAFYMTIITIATVGFREVYPMTSGGMIFTAVLIITSFGTFAYAISAISAYVIDGEFKEYFKQFKVKSEISKLKNHVIVCGYGRNGHQAASVLEAHKQSFVIIENEASHLEENLENEGRLFVFGDATVDSVLEEAGVENAKALVTTLPSDAHNLFVVLTAREKNPNLKIISRASEDNSDKKLKIAGADNVIMPDKIGGAHMASLVMKPDVIEFMDYISAQGQIDITLEEISFEELPEKFKNKSIHEIGIRNLTGANIIGLKMPDGDFVVNPKPETKITSQIKMFALGNPDQIAKLKDLFS